ncbi:MAG: hypothetical protein KDA69_05580 [Planctomycetaceae bacterium]|nr:hypothetical protein [Planctomycetaceae bacterium]
MKKGFEIVVMCVGAAVLYGILHDQITARICVEYFTIGHPRMFPTSNPTLLAFGWGFAATWWVGLLLGVPLALACRMGSWPKREPRSLVWPLIRIMSTSFVVAALAGVVGWIAASQGWVFLIGRLANQVPQEKHIPFLIDLWIHNASYLSGFVGGIVLFVFVLRDRRRQHQANVAKEQSTTLPHQSK